MSATQYKTMRAEMEKSAIALPGSVVQAGKRLLSSKGTPAVGLAQRAGRALAKPSGGAIAGAGVGAGVGAAKERSQGGSGLRGALKGGLLGAGVGAGAGAGARTIRDTRLLNPGATPAQVVGKTVSRMGSGAKRFLQRQRHGFTGAYANEPGRIGLRSSARAAEKTDLLKRRLQDELSVPRSAASKKKLLAKHREKLEELAQEGRMGDEALRAGITSIPGIAKGMVRNPKATSKAMWKDVTGGGGLGGTAMAVGLPLAITAPELARGDESDKGGKTLRQKLMETGALTAGGIATAGLPILPMMAAGAGMDTAGVSLAKRLGGNKRKRTREE